MRLTFTRDELVDLLVAWLALGVAFTVFIERGLLEQLVRSPTSVPPSTVAWALAVSLLTAGVGFLCHELAHKVVAVFYGQVAGFRADYGMLLLAILGAMAGFLFAAPGAVVHRGRLTERQAGLIALAGPLVNLVLTLAFLALLLVATEPGSALALVAGRGFVINLLLAGFNMIPFGPLDGRTVLDWHPVAFAIAFAATAVPAAAFLFGVFP